MIKLPREHLFFRDEATGTYETFSPDSFQNELEQSFQAVGIYEDWIPHEITQTVIDHLQVPAQGRNGKALTRVDIDALVKKVLIDAGYPDVAAQYCSRRGVAPEADRASEAEEWSAARIRHVLTSALAVDENGVEEVVRAVMEKLRNLGFSQVTDDLITGLGRHVLFNRNTAPEQQLEAAGQWDSGQAEGGLFLSVDPRHRLGEECLQLLEEEVITLHTSNRLLPLTWCTVNLRKYFAKIDAYPFIALSLLPEMYPLSDRCGKIVYAARQELCRECPHASAHPARVYLEGVDTLFRDMCVPMQVSEAEQLYSEMRDIMKANIADHTSFEFVLVDTES